MQSSSAQGGAILTERGRSCRRPDLDRQRQAQGGRRDGRGYLNSRRLHARCIARHQPLPRALAGLRQSHNTHRTIATAPCLPSKSFIADPDHGGRSSYRRQQASNNQGTFRPLVLPKHASRISILGRSRLEENDKADEAEKLSRI